MEMQGAPGEGMGEEPEEKEPGEKQPAVPARPRRRMGWVWWAVLLVLMLREVSPLDANLYYSKTNESYCSSLASESSGKKVSYLITLKLGDKTVQEYRHRIDDYPEMKIAAQIDPLEYSGNDWLPFYKTCAMKYRCAFKTVAGPGGSEKKGEIKGEVEARIIGACARRRAHVLMFDQAKKTIDNFFKKMGTGD